MMSLDLIIAIIALVVSIIYLGSEMLFTKNEGKDERGILIRGYSARVSFSIVTMALSFLIMFSLVFDLSTETYQMLILGILIISNVASLITTQYYKKNF